MQLERLYKRGTYPRLFCIDCEPRTVVRVRVRRSVIRVRIDETVVRIRIVTTTTKDTAKRHSTFLQSYRLRLYFHFIFTYALCRARGRVSRPLAGSLTLTLFVSFASIALFDDDFSDEGEPRTVDRVRERRSAIRARKDETAVRIRIVTTTTKDTGFFC